MNTRTVSQTRNAYSTINELIPALREDKENAMATATAAVTPSLTTSQQAAREFWRQAGADGMPPFYVMSQYYAQLSANSDNLPAVTAALDRLLTGLGYATDADTVFGELANGQAEELGYWAGRYCLFDSDGNRFDLVVGRNGATLTVPAALVDVTSLPAGTDMATVTVLSDANFSGGVLQLANAQFQVSLGFTLPVSDASFDTAEPAAAMFQSTAPRCNGTFGVVGAAGAGRPVNGKRGAWTQAGVDQPADGDPAAAWYGQYVLVDVTDVTAVKQQPDPVCIYNDPNFGLTFQWGNVYGGNVTYNNNVLQCADEDDDTTQYAMQFVAPQPGAAEINLAVIAADVMRSYKGYWVDRYSPPSPAPQARPAKRPMTAAYSAGSGAPGGGYSQAIDVSSLTSGATNKIVLPYGAIGNTYALSLNLTGCAATDTFSWTLSSDATGRAAIAGTNQTVLFSLANLSSGDVGKQLLVTVQLTKTSAAPPVNYTLQFDIVVLQCDAISLAPTVLMPVVVGAAYTQNLVAHGARGNFTWSVDASSLPPGLTWDDSSHQLSGTVTDASQVGKPFGLVVELAAPDVVMDPLTASLGITVQSAPAVASDMPPWEKIFISSMTASGVVMAALAAFAYNRYKAAKENAKTIEALKAGKTNVENATNGDPKSVSKSIVQAENATAPVVERNIPYNQNLINELTQQQKELTTKINQNEEIINKLAEYLENHKRDNWDAAVTDENLMKEGYETLGDAVEGLGALRKLNTSGMEILSAGTRWSNQVTTKTASDRINISETNISEFNNRSLLEK
jgi:hypothetical protein